jgi:hypothetical protein
VQPFSAIPGGHDVAALPFRRLEGLDLGITAKSQVQLLQRQQDPTETGTGPLPLDLLSARLVHFESSAKARGCIKGFSAPLTKTGFHLFRLAWFVEDGINPYLSPQCSVVIRSARGVCHDGTTRVTSTRKFLAPDLHSRLQSIHHRHRNVHQDDVKYLFLEHFDGPQAVVRYQWNDAPTKHQLAGTDLIGRNIFNQQDADTWGT